MYSFHNLTHSRSIAGSNVGGTIFQVYRSDSNTFESLQIAVEAKRNGKKIFFGSQTYDKETVCLVLFSSNR